LVAKSNQIAILVVDIQSDFTEYKNGALPVPGADRAYVEQLAKETAELQQAGFLIYAAQDWHPSNHTSFYTNHPGRKPFETIKLYDDREQVLWPPHCVQNTAGADLLLKRELFTAIIQKGTDPEYDSYSAFYDDCNKSTGLNELLQKNHIKTIVIYGLATDYCVRATAIDGIRAGYKVIVVKNLCRGISDETTAQALIEMAKLGVILLDTKDEMLTTLNSLSNFL
jgi:nicotinamidase/pyrazinamidase